nr:protein TRC8 homolog isoform X1 [Leptinotarsa decemlineata]
MSFLGKVDTLGPMLLRALMLFFIDQIFKIQVNYPELKNDVGQIMTHNIYEPLWYRMLLVYLFRLEILAIVCLATGFMLTTSSKHLISAYAVLSVGVLFSWIFEIVNPKPNIGCCKNETIHLLHNILALNFEKLFTQKLYISWCCLALFVYNRSIHHLIAACTLTVMLILTQWTESNKESGVNGYLLNDTVSQNFEEPFAPKVYIVNLKRTYFLQALLLVILINIYSTPKNPVMKKLLSLTFLIPLGLTFSTPAFLLNCAPILVVLLHLSLMKCLVYLVPAVWYFGLNFLSITMLDSQLLWLRKLKISYVLNTFWILTVLEQIGVFYLSGQWDERPENSAYFTFLKYVMTTGCGSFIAVLGMAHIVACICKYIAKFIQWILVTNRDHTRDIMFIAFAKFFFLALQYGIIFSKPEMRIMILFRNVCYLYASLHRSIHLMVHPSLMSRSDNLMKHVGPLSVSGIVLLLDFMFVYFIWRTQEIGTFLLDVTAVCSIAIIKFWVSLTLYTLLILSEKRQYFWEHIEDYIYYVITFDNILELCIGIFLFFNRAFILFFEMFSVIGIVRLLHQVYFNVWFKYKEICSDFRKHQTLVYKLNGLSGASSHQLRELDDVCAICYQKMLSAKVTKCGHIFHGICLRNWLDLENRCPLCNKTVI